MFLLSTCIWWYCPLCTVPQILKLVYVLEVCGFFGKGFTEFYENHIVHPTVDFVYAGRAGAIVCTRCMVWEKK